MRELGAGVKESTCPDGNWVTYGSAESLYCTHTVHPQLLYCVLTHWNENKL